MAYNERLPRKAFLSGAESVMTDVSRNTETFPAFRPAYRPGVDSIARADNADDALEIYRRTPEVVGYEEMGMEMPTRMEQIKQEKGDLWRAQQLAERKSKWSKRIILGVIVAVFVLMAVGVAFGVSDSEDNLNDGGQGNQEGDADNNYGADAGDDNGDNPGNNDGEIDDDGFQLTVPLDLNQLQEACTQFRSREGGELNRNQRFFGCLNDRDYFICDEDDNIVDTCDSDEVCICLRDNLYRGDNEPCAKVDELEEDDCEPFDFTVLA